MYESIEVLQGFLRAVRRLSGAASVSLYLPGSSSAGVEPILLHDGDSQPAPELADLDAASELEGVSTAVSTADATGVRSIPSRSLDCRLIRLAALEPRLAMASDGPASRAQDLRRRKADFARPGFHALGWIGFRFEDRRAAEADPFEGLPELLGDEPTWSELLTVGSALAWHSRRGIPKDPTTGLPSRVEFQIKLAPAIDRAKATNKPLTLLFVNPDEFAEVNERFGRDAGDTVVREIADRLRTCLRRSDLVSKYGGAVFAAILADTPLSDAGSVAEKVHASLTEGAYLDGALRLGFSVGTVVLDPADATVQEPLDLIRRADHALNTAKHSGGGRIMLWQRDSGADDLGSLDRLSGIFTANLAKDYRNMVLLWDTVTVVAGSEDFDELAGQVVERLYATFKPRRVGLFRWVGPREIVLVQGLARSPVEGSTPGRTKTMPLDAEQLTLLEEARRRSEARVRESLRASGAAGPLESAYAVPLVAGDECLGCLYLQGRQDALVLDASDLIFLKALAGQLAVAFDRARLAELERDRLRTELKELRQALQESKLLYCSPQMESVIATVRRVAPTDATVLIRGESGTGKELLARTIHELSPRRHQPLVVVDCGAIAASLIDSELFGHEKGAYTDARQRKIGRLAEAHGGTVLLDEVAELPLEVQSKLLRFVQEKQLTPVGGTRPRSVDVRVIAATNRDLTAEVAASRFREDLYYRLNVVELVVPPLRQRPDDILYLANHWLEKYSVQYHKPVRRLTREAEELLQRHPWLGNVRELQNRLMQAVILCEGEELGADELHLRGASELMRGEMMPVLRPSGRPASAGSTGSASLPATATGPSQLGEAPTPTEAREALRLALAHEIEATLKAEAPRPVPLGRWLRDDLILAAYAAAQGMLRRGASSLGIPESTFRRRVRKARAEAEAGLSMRPPTWDAIRSLLPDLISSSDGSEDLLLHARTVLMQELCDRFPDNVELASALMGTSVPTFRRWAALLDRSS